MLANDSGNGLTVVAFDVTSELGASVSISNDGSYVYDPTVSPQLDSLTVGETRIDTVKYTSEDSSGQQQQAVITIAVNGVNDAPSTGEINAQTRAGTPVDIAPLNFSADVDTGDVLTVTSVDLLGTLGAVTLNTDGTVTYDPTGVQAFADLAADTPMEDSFTYTVTDSGNATVTATVRVTVLGEPHAPVAVDDDYTSEPPLPSNEAILLAEFGESVGNRYKVLTNDTDADNNRLLIHNPGAITTNQGAAVLLFADGAFEYDPSTSVAIQALEENEVLTDSFTYMVTDSEGHGLSEATVSLNVEGVVPPVDRHPVLNLTGNGSEIEIHFDQNTSEVVVVDTTINDELLRQQSNLLLSITINGTDGDDVINGLISFSSQVPRLILNGRGGNDELIGAGRNDIINGGPGDDLIFGAAGADRLIGGPGVDQIPDTEPWDNVIDNRGPNEYVATPLNDNPTASELKQTGDLTVSVVGLDSSLRFAGPSGYGFDLAITGNPFDRAERWQREELPGGGERFTASDVVLVTDAGTIPLPGETSIEVEPDNIPRHGVLKQDTNPIFEMLTNNSIFQFISGFTNIGFGTQGFSVGLQLGEDLMSGPLSSFDAPLNNAVPYFYVILNAGNDLVTFGDDISVSGSISAQFAFVFDPVDPFFWVSGNAVGFGGAVGWSRDGRIPFTPSRTPDAVTSSRQIYGNIHASVEIPIKKLGLKGELVLDYDRWNGPGVFGSSLVRDDLPTTDFIRLLKSDSAVLNSLVDQFSRLELGLNGEVSFDPDLGPVSLSIPLGAATAMFYGGDTIAFAGGTSNPLESIPLFNDIGLEPGVRMDFDGYFEIDTADFRLQARSTSGQNKIGPFSTENNLEFVIDNSGFNVDFVIDTPISEVRFRGQVAFQERQETDFFGNTIIYKPGTFAMEASLAALDLDFEILSVRASASMRLANLLTTYSNYSWQDFVAGNVTITHERSDDVTLTLNMSVTGRSWALDVDGSATIELTVGSSGNFNISGEASLDLDWAGPGSAHFDFGISNAGIRVRVDLWVFELNVDVPIPGFLHVDQAADGSPLADDQILRTHALPGIVDEAIRRLNRTGLQQEEVDLLQTVTYRIDSLDDESRAVGYAAGTTVVLDNNAAGHGWFVDSTPSDDAEFDPVTGLAGDGSAANGRIDLLSVVMHELTHVLESARPDQEFQFGEVGQEFISVATRFRTPAELEKRLALITRLRTTGLGGAQNDLYTEIDSVFQDIFDDDGLTPLG